MPYKSQAQERFFHTQTAANEGIKPSTVKEFDKASTGMSLPKKVTAAPSEPKAPKEPHAPKMKKAITSLKQLQERANEMGASSNISKDKEAF